MSLEQSHARMIIRVISGCFHATVAELRRVQQSRWPAKPNIYSLVHSGMLSAPAPDESTRPLRTTCNLSFQLADGREKTTEHARLGV